MTSRARLLLASLVTLPLSLGACSSSPSPSGPGAGGGGAGGSGAGGSATGGGGAGGGVAPICTEPSEVPCSDQVIQGLAFADEPAPGKLDSQAEGAGFLAIVDATAGGPFNPDPDSYVYGKFTDGGLVKVALSDEESLDSMDWDIAFRRYIVRINSANSGPSCVRAARVPGEADYDGLAAVPDGLSYDADEYFTESCDLIPDGSGLEGSPATALSGYWTYPGCVKMTGNVYVLELASGRHLKLVVAAYYEPAVQDQCDSTGSVPMGSPGATLRVRWAWLP